MLHERQVGTAEDFEVVDPGDGAELDAGDTDEPCEDCDGDDCPECEESFSENCGTGDGGFKASNTCAGDGGSGSGERGARAIFKGKKVRTISPRARINYDQMMDLMGERGYEVGKPQSSPKGTFYPVKKGNKVQLVPAKAIQKFLATENMDI